MADEKRTMFAMAAIDFAGLFNSVFQTFNLGGFKIRCTAPEGQSTGGGVQARQHFTLVNEAANRTVVIGGANTVDRTAELRTYQHVTQLHQQRYNGDPPFSHESYVDLTTRLISFLQGQGMQVSEAPMPAQRPAAQAAPAKAAAKAPAAEGGGGMSGKTIGIIAAVVVVVVVVLVLALR